ncbi:hypothetical protein QBC44DRAFT_29046 [Cladorrhinum sp. PSN332]|nr:hypothetical protein QBC44DRAFT_29046 [Cladorrhinum sp. PSN332]
MAPNPFICRRCIRAMRLISLPQTALSRAQRYLSQSANPSPTSSSRDNASSTHDDSRNPKPPDPEPERGAMTRRLQEATEEALFTGGRAGQRAIEDAGFSSELKERLLSKISDAKFQTEHSSAFIEANIHSRLPAAAGEGTRATATSRAWTGEESQEDAVLRMLEDARKPLAHGLRGKPKIPSPVIDMRLRRDPARNTGQKVADARERAAAYTDMGIKNDVGLTEKEREELRQEFRERFQPNARAMPNTLSGLAALANERIENAIARGQFKNIPRGKGVKRDARADNPFIDTTEYIMNKMIKRQDIVPPWIEKQQELLKAAQVFRARLRQDWRRHAARIISSQGGTLEAKVVRAKEYARAELVHNPRRRNLDQISVPSNSTDDPVMVKMRQQQSAAAGEDGSSQHEPQSQPEQPEEDIPTVRPFRDSAWLQTEAAYHNLAISNLNAITRSYNLMAPELAKKPYFSLERELKNCFADVAPQVAEEIRMRDSKPTRSLVDYPFGGESKRKGILGGLGGDGKATRVWESKEPRYGLKEWWGDLWGKK